MLFRSSSAEPADTSAEPADTSAEPADTSSTKLSLTDASSADTESSTPNNTNSSSTIVTDYSLVHAAIEIGKPVTWTQNVTLSNQAQSIVIEVPADAVISQVQTSDGPSQDLPTAATSFFNQPALTLLDQVPEMVQEQKPTKLLAIDQASKEYSLTFETPAPYTTEEDTSTPELYSKQVTVAHDSALHYTDVKSYSDIPEDLVSQGIPFKL